MAFCFPDHFIFALIIGTVFAYRRKWNLWLFFGLSAIAFDLLWVIGYPSILAFMHRFWGAFVWAIPFTFLFFYINEAYKVRWHLATIPLLNIYCIVAGGMWSHVILDVFTHFDGFYMFYWNTNWHDIFFEHVVLTEVPVLSWFIIGMFAVQICLILFSFQGLPRETKTESQRITYKISETISSKRNI